MTPQQFCWTKFGAEAGDDPHTILNRKEEERLANGGVFLWGIGSSIRPSLLALLDSTPRPIVLFTPMLSKASAHDRSPDGIGLWCSAFGLDGRPFEIPVGTRVTSGIRGDQLPRRHYALVCRRDTPLINNPDDEQWLDDEHLRNLRTGLPIGASQVTAVVKRTLSERQRRRYRVAFSAWLVAPFQVTLRDCERIM